MMTRLRRKFNHPKRNPSDRSLSQFVYPSDIRTFPVHLLQHLDDLFIVVVLEFELMRSDQEYRDEQKQIGTGWCHHSSFDGYCRPTAGKQANIDGKAERASNQLRQPVTSEARL